MRWLAVLFIVQNVLLASISCFNVECEFIVENWGLAVSGNVCVTKNVVVQSPNQTVTSINGQTGFQGRDVNIIRIDEQTLHYLPRGFEKFFSDIQGIHFGHSNIKSINKYDLKQFSNLKVFYMHNNALEKVDADLFEFTPDVSFVYFNGNSLKSVGANAFSKLEKLTYAYFSSCGCINKNAESRSAVIELMAELKEKCSPPEDQKEKYCGKDFEKFHAEITELKLENKELKAQLKALRSEYESNDIELKAQLKALRSEYDSNDNELKAQLKALTSKSESIDGNLNSAVENLFQTKNKDESIESPKKLKSELTCKFDRDDKCDVVELKIKFPNSAIAKVKNESDEIVATSQVTKMTIADQQTFFLPNNLADYFLQLTNLGITNSGLYGIDSFSFKGLRSLVILVVKFNKVMQIPSDAFKDQENLRELDISFNKIRIISKGAFKGVQKLQNLMLNDNSLEMINNQIFGGLNNLESLSLQNNKLKFLSPNLFSQLAKLSSADFTNNVCIDMAHPNVTKEIITEAIVDSCIASIDLQCFFGDDKIFLDEISSIEGYMCKVHDLTVDYPASRISKLSGTHLINKDVDTVTAFVSIEQSMSFIPLDLADRLPNLEIVLIDKSGLTSLQRNDFKKMRQLKKIVIRHNNLTAIDEGTFDDNDKISYLDLSYNGIVSLPPKVFSKLVNLENLLLTNNQLTELSANLLPRRNSVKQFRANSNRIDRVETRVLRTLSNSQIVDFTDNTCTDMKFDKSDKSGPTFNELFFEINFKCCEDCD